MFAISSLVTQNEYALNRLNRKLWLVEKNSVQFSWLKVIIFILFGFLWGAQFSEAGSNVRATAVVGTSGSYGKFGNGGMGLSQRDISLFSADSLVGVPVGKSSTLGLWGSYFLKQQHTAISKVNGTNLAGQGFLIGSGYRTPLSNLFHLQVSIFFIGKYSFKYQTTNTRDSFLDMPLGAQVKLQRRVKENSLWTIDLMAGWNRWRNYHTGGFEFRNASKFWSVGFGVSRSFDWRKPNQETNEPVVSTDAQKLNSLISSSSSKPAKAISVYYPPREWMLKAADREAVKRFYEQFYKDSSIKVLLVGHTDSIGTKERNEYVANQRIEKLKEFLIQLGIPETNIQTRSQSNLEPAVSNDSPEGRAKNRRVDLSVVEEK